MPIQLPPNDPCYFCQIIDGKTERWSVLEHTELTVTVLNGRQFEVGQCIVLTRRHAPTRAVGIHPSPAILSPGAQRRTRIVGLAPSPAMTSPGMAH
jgi:hypothetical protein